MCLCRRHHRIKQRPGWSVRLAVDGTATCTDPVGRERVTWPRNHLDLLTLPAEPAPVAAARPQAPAGTPASKDRADHGRVETSTPARPETARPRAGAQEVSTLETILDVLGDGYRTAPLAERHTTPRPWRGDVIRPRPGWSRLRYHRSLQHPRHRTHDAGRSISAPIETEPPPF